MRNIKPISIGPFLAVLSVLYLSATLHAAEEKKVDINSASIEELMTLKYVGKTIAQRIIDHRIKLEGFKTPVEIQQIKGFGSKAWEVNKDRIIALPIKKEGG
jgi:competence ComEA-like helix-hairpin-helix protein